MRFDNGNTIGRRRGASAAARGKARSLVLNQKSLLVLAALCATIFATGLILGTHIFGTPDETNTSPKNGSGSGTNPNGHRDAEASPLAAASAKVAASDIQNLILESARAEKIEKRERELEREALNRGDKKTAAHLRGVLAPGDANYNPHLHVDDVQNDDGVGAGDGALGDGGMYAGGGDGQLAEEEKEDMGNHFAEALIEEAKEKEQEMAEKLKESVDGMHQHFAEVVEGERKAMDALKSGKAMDAVKSGLHHAAEKIENIASHGLRGASANGDGNNLSLDDGNSSLPHYPYLTAAVPEDHDFKAYSPLGGGRFVEYKDGDTPYNIDKGLISRSDELARSRRVHVGNAMKHIWKGYKKYAFGKDELHPMSHTSTNNWGGMGTSLVDSLDTLWLMGMKDEFWEGRDWVRDHLNSDISKGVSVFETTIRSLGGLLAAYDLSEDKAFLEKADDLGSRLVKAYDSPAQLPYGNVNLHTGTAQNYGWTGGSFLLAEVGTQQIEYRYLSRATGKEDYEIKADRVFDILEKMMPDDGLMPLYINRAGTGFSNKKISFGAMGDSAYEYMIKIWVQGGKKEQKYRDMWDKSMQGMHDKLLQKSFSNGFTYIADIENGRMDHKMDHLVCFMGGALALGAYTDPNGLDSPRAQRDLKTAKALTYTCYQMYARTKTGISPEFVKFKDNANDMEVPASAPYYILRPEAVEAFYYLSVLTGDPIYREWGWEVFQSIERYCKLENGYGSLHNVNMPDMKPEDKMESFFMAETLKYLYLLFDPDSEIDILNKHVFNTEAHPLKIFNA